MKRVWTYVLGLVALPCFVADAQPPSALAVGQPAIDFTLPYATKDSISRVPFTLSEAIGRKNIVLAFYPADWSGGCTKEVCALRDDWGNLEALNAEVLGISGDYVYSHHEWAKHHNLPFKLLSDHSHEVAKAYESYNDRTGYNRRTVVVIDRLGTIAYIDLQYSVADDEDFKRLKEALSKLQ
jgi:peroxiredoxin